MAPKTKTAVASKASSSTAKLSYKDMIKTAIAALKERNGSSRQALKKYVQSNYDVKAINFDTAFNAALRKGVENGDFLQPKGPSGPVKNSKKPVAEKKEKEDTETKEKEKIVHSEASKVTKPKKPVAKKVAAPKKAVAAAATTKKAAPASKKKAPVKKAAVSKKAAPAKKTTSSRGASKRSESIKA